MLQTNIIEAAATGEEIYAIVTKLEPVLNETPRSHAVIACLSIAITAMNPNISSEHLAEAVKGASEWICLYMSTISHNAEQVAPNQMN